MTLRLVIISHVSRCKHDFREKSLGVLMLVPPNDPFERDIKYPQNESLCI